MPKLKIIPVGSIFHKLKVIEGPISTKGKPIRYKVICDCGVTKTIASSSLKEIGGTRSCGCLQKESARMLKFKHGYSVSKNPYLYRTWESMRRRCTNPRCHEYKRYGGRGIAICARWDTFENFLEDMGEKPSPSHSLDRIDNNLGYSPDNCRWATKLEQVNNTRHNVYVNIQGITLTFAEWERKLGLRQYKLKDIKRDHGMLEVHKYIENLL